jgi:hypothetical protein
MAYIESSLTDDSRTDFLKDGFLSVKDANAGERVEEMETKSVVFASERGLTFYKVNVLDDPVGTTMLLCHSLRTHYVLAQTTDTRFFL